MKFTDCFTNACDTPSCGLFSEKLSTRLFTFRGNLGGKVVENGDFRCALLVDYSHVDVDNFSAFGSLWITYTLIHIPSRSYPQGRGMAEALQNVGFRRLPTLSTGLIITNIVCFL